MDQNSNQIARLRMKEEDNLMKRILDQILEFRDLNINNILKEKKKTKIGKKKVAEKAIKKIQRNQARDRILGKHGTLYLIPEIK